jgi:hypothetical protein
MQRLLLQVSLFKAADACLQPLLQLLVLVLCALAAGTPCCHVSGWVWVMICQVHACSPVTLYIMPISPHAGCSRHALLTRATPQAIMACPAQEVGLTHHAYSTEGNRSSLCC